MIQLQYIPITSDSELGNFDCGNASINKIIGKSFRKHLYRQVHVTKVCMEGYCVGCFIISFVVADVSGDTSSIAEYYEDPAVFAGVNIDVIAVNKYVHNHGIGKTMLRHIIHMTRAFSDKWPIRFISLDALREKVPWYLKNGFDYVDEKKAFGYGETVPLYLDLLSEEERVKFEEDCFYE